MGTMKEEKRRQRRDRKKRKLHLEKRKGIIARQEKISGNGERIGVRREDIVSRKSVEDKLKGYNRASREKERKLGGKEEIRW